MRTMESSESQRQAWSQALISAGGWLTLLVLTAGCAQQPAPPPAGSGATTPNPVAVTLARPVRQALQRAIEQPGQIEPFEQTPLVAKVAGYVRKVRVDIGDRVKENDVLVEIGVPEMEEELVQKRAIVKLAQAAVDQAQAALQTAEANIGSTEAQVREAEAGRKRAQAYYERWDSEHKRVESLVRKGVIDKQTGDETEHQYRAAVAAQEEVEAKVRSAKASHGESMARRERARTDVAAARAHQQVTEADERRLQALMQYTMIRSPFAGVITHRKVDTGHFLQPMAGAKAEPILVVVRNDPVRVVVDVPEADAPLVKTGAEARVGVQALHGKTFKGKVARTSAVLDTRSRTLRTEIDLPNPTGELLPGMYAYGSVIVPLPPALTLPSSAVIKQGENLVCFFVPHGKARRLLVQVGASDGKSIEVLKKRAGLDEPWEEFTGDEEVIVNASGLTAGQAVMVQEKP